MSFKKNPLSRLMGYIMLSIGLAESIILLIIIEDVNLDLESIEFYIFSGLVAINILIYSLGVGLINRYNWARIITMALLFLVLTFWTFFVLFLLINEVKKDYREFMMIIGCSMFAYPILIGSLFFLNHVTILKEFEIEEY